MQSICAGDDLVRHTRLRGAASLPDSKRHLAVEAFVSKLEEYVARRRRGLHGRVFFSSGDADHAG
jgi:hypothetical protein